MPSTVKGFEENNDKNKLKIILSHKKFIIQLVLKIVSHLNSRHLSCSLPY